MNADDGRAAATAALKALAPGGRLTRPGLPYGEVLRQAETQLGPFASLPPALRGELVRLQQRDEAVRTLADGRLSRALAASGALLSRMLYGGERGLTRAQAWLPLRWQPALERARRTVRGRARQSTHAPFWVRRRLQRAGARWRLRTRRATLDAVLQARGFDVAALGYEYLQELRQIPGCASVLTRPEMTCTQLIGVDFVQSGGILWFLEANGNPALMDARLALYAEDADPWVERILECAAARGRGRVVVYGYRPFSPGHAAALVAGGRRRGMAVTVVDDLFAARHAAQPRAWLIDAAQARDALVVRAKTFDVLFDRAVLSKRQTRRIVAPQRARLEAAGVAVPELIGPGASAPHYRAESGHPNVVAKIDGLDRGAGVSFYKLAQIPAALAARADFLEEYHLPDPCPLRIVRNARVPLADARPRAWKIRSYALLTPEGVEYLSSIKVISGRPMPERLADGPVAEKSIYLATINEGGVYSAVSADEDQAYRRAVDAVGGILLEWLARKYGADAVQPPAPARQRSCA